MKTYLELLNYFVLILGLVFISAILISIISFTQAVCLSNTKIVCENDNFLIDCGPESIVEVTSVFYGRQDSNICGYSNCLKYNSAAVCNNAVSNNLNCNSNYAQRFNYVEGTCSGSECNGKINNGLYINSFFLLIIYHNVLYSFKAIWVVIPVEVLTNTQL